MVFLEFQKWPSPVTNVPNNSLIIASAGLLPAPFEVTDWLPGVELPDNYSPWQVDLCAAVGAVRTIIVHTGGLPAMQTNMRMEGEKVDWLTCMFLWEIIMIICLLTHSHSAQEMT